MSYEFDPRRSYRMPTHFGPLPGPRQRPEGGFHPADTGQRSVGIWASFDAERAQIADLLPPGFVPAEAPDLTIEIKSMTNIGWLAGRGYNVVTVSTAVRREAASDDQPSEGRFKLVLWENHADPIITGREELGYPKVYAEIDDVVIDGDSARAAASWDGFTFLELDVAGLGDHTSPAPGGPSFHMKYLPRTGVAAGHEVVQTILTPPGQGPLEVVERRSGTGSVHVNAGTWEQLPTLVNIVGALAVLRLGGQRGAGFFRTAGTTDLRDQIVIPTP